MFEITREMMDEAIGEERRLNAASDKSVKAVVVILLIVLGAEIIAFIMLLSANILKGLIFAVAAAAADFVLLFLTVIIMSKKYIKGFEVGAFISAFKNRNFNEYIKTVDKKAQILLYEDRLAKSKTDDERIRNGGTLLELYAVECQDKKADKMFEEISRLVPKRNIAKIAKLDSALYYYSSKDDAESFCRAYESGGDIIEMWWNNSLDLKFALFGKYIVYTIVKKEYEKALELYTYNLEARERAGEFNAECGINDEMRNVACIDLAMLYFNTGGTEKAEECMREAERRFADGSALFIQKQMEKLRAMFDGAGIKLTVEQNDKRI